LSRKFISPFRFHKRKKKRQDVKIRDSPDRYNFKPVDDDLASMFLHPAPAYHIHYQ